jgi:long-subunit acyl-CoA synthetase (AMP-forming)
MNSTLCALMQQTIRDHADQTALRSADGRITLTWGQYGAQVESVARGLAARGVKRGDTVGLMLTNRPEFHIVDAAVMHLGAVPYSIYNTSSAEQITYLLTNACNTILVTEARFLDVLSKAIPDTAVDTIICVDQAARQDRVVPLADVQVGGSPAFDFTAAWQNVRSDDILTLIYTSGTTGHPKGVEITHSNIVYVLTASTRLLGEHTGGRVVSYLPDAHIVNRYMAHYAAMAYHLTTTTLDDPKRLLEVLRQVRPTLFVGAPALWYRIIGSLETALAGQTGVKGRLARWAIGVGKKRAGSPGRRMRGRGSLADRLVLSKIRAQLGLDQLYSAVTGSAPLDHEAMIFLLGLGLPLSEAWGLSETTGVSTLNIPAALRLGTVGRPLEGTEVRVADDGELLIRGGGVMKGYRADPAKTVEALDDGGWLHTGDVGRIDADGYVTVVDRKKDLIINTSGKNMSPANIENAVMGACPLIASVIAIGDRRPWVGALLTIDAEAATALAVAHGQEGDRSLAAVVAAPAVRQAVQEGVDKANARLSRVEHIRSFDILAATWEPGGDELTPTLKLKRRPIIAKYAAQIDALYAS